MTSIVSDGTGIRLSELLGQVRGAVAAMATKVWVQAEISQVSDRGGSGHVYVDLVEHEDGQKQPVAKARAILWRAVAARVLPAFEQVTGSRLAAGMKVLVQVTPEFSETYGLSLRISDIDPRFTMGEMAARLMEIRRRLIELGEFDRQRSLELPVDLFHVAIIAPVGAAGLGDVMREARELEARGVCRFDVRGTVFQGEQAPEAIIEAISAAYHAAMEAGNRLDAIMIIRGGGAASDLAHLNDLRLARTICRCPVPVFTGIGHERDNTILDEVACQRFDTPSKAMHVGVLGTLRKRARSTSELLGEIESQVRAQRDRMLARVGRASDRAERGARQQQTEARRRVTAAAASARENAVRLIGEAKAEIRAGVAEVRATALGQVTLARAQSQETQRRVSTNARRQLTNARSSVQSVSDRVLSTARRGGRQATIGVHETLLVARRAAWRQINDSAANVADLRDVILRAASNQGRRISGAIAMSLAMVSRAAHRQVADAKRAYQSKYREIVAQGPGRSLKRGFAYVTRAKGTVRRAAELHAGDEIQVTLVDGKVRAKVLDAALTESK